MSTLSTMSTNVLNTLGESGSGFITTAEAQKWINDGMNIANESGLVVQEEATDTTVADQANYNLPTGAALLTHVFIGDDRLTQISIAEWRYRKENGASSDGETFRAYAEWDSQVWTDPTPQDASGTIRFYYYKATAALTTSDSPDFASTLHHILEDYALHRAYLKYRNPQMAQEHERAWLNGLGLLKRRYGQKFSHHRSRMEVVR